MPDGIEDGSFRARSPDDLELEASECADEVRPLINVQTSPIRRRTQSVNNYSSINTKMRRNILLNSSMFSHSLKKESDNFLSSKFQSLDYDRIFNMISFKDSVHIGRKQLARWFVMFIVGVLTAIIAVIIDTLVEHISEFKYSFIASKMSFCSERNCLWQPLLIWMCTNVGFSLIAASLVIFIAPAATGSGIPMVKCYLNGVKIPEVIRFKTLISKVLGVVFSVCGGLAVGKEGPMIHSGSIVAAGVSQGFSTSLGIDLNIFRYFRTDTEKRDFVSGGASAGVSAAFGAPVGGVLFSLEEGASFWNQALTWRIFFCSMVSTFTLNMLLSLAHGNFGDMSSPGLINFGKFTNVAYKWFELPIFILMGAFAGLIGALFNYINIKLTRFRSTYVKNKLVSLAEVGVVAAMSAVAGFFLSFYVRTDCQPIGRDIVSKYPVQLFCHDGEYNAMSGLFFQTPENSVRSLFHDSPGSFDPYTLGIFCVAYFILAVWTYGLPIPSGLFIPSLLIGAAWGRLVGILVAIALPNAKIDPGTYALIGAASMLGGILRMTLSLTVIVTEATGEISLGLPIMFAIMTSKFVGDLFNEGLFDMHIQLSGLPLLDWDPPPLTEQLSAFHIMARPVKVLREVETAGNIYDMLVSNNYHGFPVVDDRDCSPPESTEDNVSAADKREHFGVLKGLILRHQLLTLLKRKTYLPNACELAPDDFRSTYPRYVSLSSISMSAEERTCLLDLRPYMNLSPYSLTENSNLPRIFRLFRGLGLRHIVIVDMHNRVTGIVTRIDIAKYRAHVGIRNTVVQQLNVTM